MRVRIQWSCGIFMLKLCWQRGATRKQSRWFWQLFEQNPNRMQQVTGLIGQLLDAEQR